MKWSLRNRIMFPVIGLVAVLIGAVVVVAFLMSRSMITNAFNQQLEGVARSALSEVENWIDVQKVNLADWTTQQEVVAATGESEGAVAARKSVDTHMTQLMAISDIYEGINVTNAQGKTIAGANMETAGKVDVSDRTYIKKALAGEFAISDVLASRRSGTPIVVVAAPVKEGSVVKGAVFAVLRLEQFSSKFINPIKVLDTGYAYLFDETGLVLAHPSKEKILKFKIGDYSWGQEMLKVRNGDILYSLDGIEKKVFFRMSNALRWSVAITAPTSELHAPIRRMTWTISFLGLGALVTGGVVTFFTARAIASPVRKIADTLSEGSDQTATAATQLAAASHSLAEGASEQAASLEETSSSLEEMSSMTARNSENAQKATDLARQTRAAAESGARDMESMAQAMNGIKSSSDDIAKIVKTIDEIAFQTNILALNAAVEAARAGEAGMGFAVVADEVRTLAQRSAHAARETAGMIEGAISRTTQGVAISAKVGQALQEIVDKARRVDGLVAEVAGASKEQSQGISQVNTAVSQMDKVTQTNAASAEETAGAVEELSSQAAAMKTAVSELLRMVDGGEGAQHAAAPEHASLHQPGAFSGKSATPALRRGLAKAHAKQDGWNDFPAETDAGHPNKKP